MHFLQKHTWIIIALAIVISFSFPSIGVLISPFVHYILMILMFLSLLTIRMRDVITQLSHIKEIILLILIIHFLGPLLILPLKPFLLEDIFIGLLLITMIPSGISVVFLTKIFGGNPSKALPITVISHFISPLVMPLIMVTIAQSSFLIPFKDIMLNMSKLILIPYVGAWLIRRTSYLGLIQKHSLSVSQILLLLLIIRIVSPMRMLIMQHLNLVLQLAIFSVLYVIVTFTISYKIGKVRKDKITFGIVGSYKNFSLSSVIALSIFSPIAALPSIVFALVNNLMLIVLEFISPYFHSDTYSTKRYRK